MFPMKKIFFLFTLTLAILSFLSCRGRITPKNEQMPLASVKTTSVKQGDIENKVSFNGKIIILKKNPVVSPIAGYVVRINIKFGDEVQRDNVLFEIQTRESQALGNSGVSGNNLGTIKVTATSGGFVNELFVNETGGYIVEGGQLCSIAENKDLMVKVNVPFEFNSLLTIGRKCNLFLPDKTSFEGYIFQVLPVMDETNQTQSVLIRPETKRKIPENLNLTIQFVNEKHNQSCLINRSAIMTNETQDVFWVMKIINNNMAVRIPVNKGIENDSIVEILSSDLKRDDIVISEGAYGLPDSTIVRVEE